MADLVKEARRELESREAGLGLGGGGEKGVGRPPGQRGTQS